MPGSSVSTHNSVDRTTPRTQTAPKSPCSSAEGSSYHVAYGPRTLLPEIRIDTSRLDDLLSVFQRRLGALEKAFSKVADSAAEAAHKVLGHAKSTLVTYTHRKWDRDLQTQIDPEISTNSTSYIIGLLCRVGRGSVWKSENVVKILLVCGGDRI